MRSTANGDSNQRSFVLLSLPHTRPQTLLPMEGVRLPKVRPDEPAQANHGRPGGPPPPAGTGRGAGHQYSQGDHPRGAATDGDC